MPVARVRDEARRELRKLGARAEVRGPATGEDSGVGSLTKRELEIAELITDRLTNPQIAEKLFLSKKTIETHIRNIFVKLGASSWWRWPASSNRIAESGRGSGRAVSSAAAPVDADAARLRELGYPQELSGVCAWSTTSRSALRRSPRGG